MLTISEPLALAEVVDLELEAGPAAAGPTRETRHNRVLPKPRPAIVRPDPKARIVDPTDPELELKEATRVVQSWGPGAWVRYDSRFGDPEYGTLRWVKAKWAYVQYRGNRFATKTSPVNLTLLGYYDPLADGETDPTEQEMEQE